MTAPNTISEEFIHYIWENRLFTQSSLKTVKNEPVEIIDTGWRNTDSGPDFFNARVKIAGTLWAGNIEMHKKASDWEKHNHTSDKAYDNVILHVVEDADKQVYRGSGTAIATIELKWPAQLTENYQRLLAAKTWIACQEQFTNVNPILLRLGFNRLMIERLEEKTEEINHNLVQNCHNWNETFFQMLSRMFGFKVNAAPFEMLAKSVPMHILGKHKNNLFQLEALLFGASGLLSEELFGDPYFMELLKEFSFLQKKYKLVPVQPHLWKFMRLRPGNFPTIRISQLAALIHSSQGLFSHVLDATDVKKLQELFSVKASDYWNCHYRFNRPSKRILPKDLGESSVNTIIVNVVIPFLFVYGEKHNLHHLKDRALGFLEQLPAETNSVINKWGKLGVDVRSAFDSQALLQLKNRHCDRKKCLHCPAGNNLVRTR